MKKKNFKIAAAAPQIGIFKKVIAIGYPQFIRNFWGMIGPVEFQVLINPEITYFSKEMIKAPELCLSVNGYEGYINRPKVVKVKALNPEGKVVEFEAGGQFARCIQHEIDHLDGILFVDRIEDIRDLRKIEYVSENDPVLAFNKNFNKNK